MPIDPIEAYHRAGRRRKVFAYAVGGSLLMLLGAVAVALYVWLGDVPGPPQKIRALTGGVALLIGGALFLRDAYRLAIRRIDDTEGDVGPFRGDRVRPPKP